MKPEDVTGPLASWCKQTVLFALMVRANDLGKSIPDRHVREAFVTAEEVYQKALAQAGPVDRYPKVQAWITAVVDEMFRWVQDHLER